MLSVGVLGSQPRTWRAIKHITAEPFPCQRTLGKYPSGEPSSALMAKPQQVHRCSAAASIKALFTHCLWSLPVIWVWVCVWGMCHGLGLWGTEKSTSCYGMCCWGPKGKHGAQRAPTAEHRSLKCSSWKPHWVWVQEFTSGLRDDKPGLPRGGSG